MIMLRDDPKRIILQQWPCIVWYGTSKGVPSAVKTSSPGALELKAGVKLREHYYCREHYISCPFPSKHGIGVQVWEGLSGGYRAEITLERFRQLAVLATQSVS